MDKQDRITRALELNNIMKTHEVAEYCSIPAHEAEEILRGMEDLALVFAVGSESWQLNQ